MINLTMNMPFSLMGFYGSIMIVTVLVLRGLLKSRLPKFVFPLFWGVILLRLLIPFSLSSPLSMKVPDFFRNPFYEAASMINLIEDLPMTAEMNVATAQNQPKTIVPETTVLETTALETTALETTASETIVSEAIISEIPLEAEATATATEGTALNISYTSFDDTLFYHLLIFIYLGGLFVTISVLLIQKYQYTKRLKNALLIEHNETINTLLREINMGQILVFTNDEIASPLVCGLFAPKIYLPTRMDFSNTELLRHILCHETMHIRRKDNWIKAVMLVTLCLHWFNPLVWIMSKYLASDLELACDEAVLRHYDKEDEIRKNYALSLLTMAITGNRPTLLYSAFSKTEVERRIQSVLQYRKASSLLLLVSICFVLSGSVVFATGGQAPFSSYLTSFCASDSCRWGVQASLTRGAFLGKNAENKAEELIFEIMRTDTTNDPDILEEQILTALSEQFHVERNAFALSFSLCFDREELFKEYAQWGLVREDEKNDTLLYKGETIRTYSDKMIGRYISQQNGAVDITVERSRLGEITAVNVFRKGDTVYDRRTRELQQSKFTR
ncbi:MAG: M56 family metallopeptidase [Lachnospiraceae bacterium]|jgi:beta-lactamase regulating signal transducer with metallopeptidase domain|nr:M56 family metallopeptidase [Lachnospiraceae bacterium]